MCHEGLMKINHYSRFIWVLSKVSEAVLYSNPHNSLLFWIRSNLINFLSQGFSGKPALCNITRDWLIWAQAVRMQKPPLLRDIFPNTETEMMDTDIYIVSCCKANKMKQSTSPKLTFCELKALYNLQNKNNTASEINFDYNILLKKLKGISVYGINDLRGVSINLFILLIGA